MTTKISAKDRKSIEICSESHTVCLETLAYAINKGESQFEPKLLRLLLDCAEICQTSTNFMLRSSEFSSHACGVSAEISRRCADECHKLADEDEVMKHCAEVCRRCADSCKKMSAVAVAA